MWPDSTVPKILHVVLSMAVGGAERLVYDMVRHPCFAGNKPIVCCLDSIGELGVELKTQGFLVYCKQRSPGLDWQVIPWLRRIILEEQVDIIHAHQYTPLFYTVPAAFFAGRKKVVYTEHGRFYPERKSWKRALVNPMLAYGVGHLIAISKATAQAMADYDHFPLDRIKIIHNGIDTSQMQPTFDKAGKRQSLGLSPSSRVLGTAARLNTIKNMPMMLRGFKLVLAQIPDLYLLIAGQGEELAYLQALAKELAIDTRVKFIGLRFDLPEIYQLFDVFLLTSFSEGISITLLEAMACGIPAVVTDVGGNPEVVVAGETGFLVPVDNDHLFAERIIEVLTNQELAKKMSILSQKRVEEEYSISRMLHGYQQLYGIATPTSPHDN